MLSLMALTYHFLETLRYTSIAINDNTKTAHITPEVKAIITTISNDSENKNIVHSNGALRIDVQYNNIHNLPVNYQIIFRSTNFLINLSNEYMHIYFQFANQSTSG